MSPLFFLPVALHVVAGSVPSQEVVRAEFEGLTVSYVGTAEYFVEDGTATFDGSITAQYDQTVLECARLNIDFNTKQAVADGGVRLLDPEASLTTESINFNWGEKTGEAQNVSIIADNVRIKAGRLLIEPGTWYLFKVRATLSRRDNPNYEVLAERVRIHPGDYGIAEHLGLEIFGSKLGWIGETRFDLDPRVTGFKIPSVTNKRGAGMGISWDSSFLLSDKMAIDAYANSFPQNLPGYGLQLSFTEIDPAKVYKKIRPRSDLSERIGGSFFDNITVKTTTREQNGMRDPKMTFALGTLWNQSTFARAENSDTVSKMYDAIIESTGEAGGLGLSATGRIQRIRPDRDTSFIDRATLLTTVGTPQWQLADNFHFGIRVDGFGTYSKNAEFGWVRVQPRLTYAPNQHVQVGVAYSHGEQFGVPEYEFDPLPRTRMAHARIDLNSGPYTIRYLWRYDTLEQRLFDTQYELALVAEAFEPYIVFRTEPSDFRMGIRFRIDGFRNRLSRRNVERDLRRD